MSQSNRPFMVDIKKKEVINSQDNVIDTEEAEGPDLLEEGKCFDGTNFTIANKVLDRKSLNHERYHTSAHMKLAP
jgi:hypothetical protein